MVSNQRRNILILAELAPTIPPPWPHWPLVGGVIGGFIFLVLLIVLINCYVQKNRGEQYYGKCIYQCNVTILTRGFSYGNVWSSYCELC